MIKTSCRGPSSRQELDEDHMQVVLATSHRVELRIDVPQRAKCMRAGRGRLHYSPCMSSCGSLSSLWLFEGRVLLGRLYGSLRSQSVFKFAVSPAIFQRIEARFLFTEHCSQLFFHFFCRALRNSFAVALTGFVDRSNDLCNFQD